MIEPVGSQGAPSNLVKHFGFRDTPFGVTPDPRFFYSNVLHLEGLKALAYGIEAKKGFLLLTGEVGTGKTILIRKLMRHLEASVKFVFVSASHLISFDPIELLAQELRLIHRRASRLEMVQALNAHLTRQIGKGHTVALLIDEAQKLCDEALESLCDLSNLETEEEKLIQIVLVGQPELANNLSKSSARRLKQRIAMHYSLGCLQTSSELGNYIRHRLRVASYDGPEIFTQEAVEAIWCYSGGAPRLVNAICDNALALACDVNEKRISRSMIIKVAGDLLLLRSDVPKIEVSDNGAPKAKAPAVRSYPMMARTNGIEMKRGDRPERPIVRLRATDPGPMPAASPKEAAVPTEFFDRMIGAAVEAMGPMAHLVVRDQISALGESDADFPQIKLEQLVQSVSREIWNEAMRARFQNAMSREISALKTL
jgi:general secretion pathway protein A